MNVEHPILTSALVGAAVGGGVGAFALKPKARPADVVWMAGLGAVVGLVYGGIRERRAEAHVFR